MPSPARRAAWKALIETEKNHSTLKSVLALHEAGLNERDQSLYRELIFGVYRHRSLLDWTLSKFIRKPLSSTPAAGLGALRLGTFQILFMDRVPHHAAVDESVEIAKKYAGMPVGRFVNAVLRNILRNLSDIQPPDPRTDPIRNIPVRFSHPEWLISRWLDRFGVDETISLCEANNMIPRLSLRINSLSTNRDKFLSELEKANISAEASDLSPLGVILSPGTALGSLPDELWKDFQVQDVAAQMITPLLGARPGERILDACAAPGGKTTHLAELMSDKGVILAVDKNQNKLALLNENAGRLSLSSIETRHGDLTRMKNLGFFDKILLDAPCSALGIIRRQPDVKWRRQESDLVRNSRVQGILLRTAAAHLKSGGTLLYAVCSNEPEEGEHVIRGFLEDSPLFRLENTGREHGAPYFETMPHRDGTDGFFAALLVRQ